MDEDAWDAYHMNDWSDFYYSSPEEAARIREEAARERQYLTMTDDAILNFEDMPGLNTFVNKTVADYIEVTKRKSLYPENYKIPQGVLLAAQAADVAAIRHTYGNEDLTEVPWTFKKRSGGRNTRDPAGNPIPILVPSRLVQTQGNDNRRNLNIANWIRNNTNRVLKKGPMPQRTPEDLVPILKSLRGYFGLQQDNPNDDVYEDNFGDDGFDDADDIYSSQDDFFLGRHYIRQDGVIHGRDDIDQPLLTRILGRRQDRRGIPQGSGDWHDFDLLQRSRFGDRSGQYYHNLWERFRFFTEAVKERVQAWAEDAMYGMRARSPYELLSGFKRDFNIREVVGPDLLAQYEEIVDELQDLFAPYDAEEIDYDTQRRHRFLSILSTIVGQGMLPLLQAMNDVAAHSVENPDFLYTEHSDEPFTLGVTPIVTSDNSPYSWVLTEEMTSVLGRAFGDELMQGMDVLFEAFLNNPDMSPQEFLENFNLFQQLMMEDGIARVEEMGSDIAASPLRIVGGSSYLRDGSEYPTITLGFRQRHLPGQPYYSLAHKPGLVPTGTDKSYITRDLLDQAVSHSRRLNGQRTRHYVTRYESMPFDPDRDWDPDFQMFMAPPLRGRRHRIKRPLYKRPPRPKKTSKRNRGRPRGRWAPYTCDLKGLDLRILQIETTGKGFDNSNLPCLVFACQESNILSKAEIDEMLRFTAQPFTLLRSLSIIGDTFDIHFRVTEGDGKTIRHFGPRKGRRIDLCFVDNHFCLNVKHPYTQYALEHWDEVYEKFGHGMVTKYGNKLVETKRGEVSTLQLLNILKRNGKLSPLSWTDDRALGTKFLQAWAFNDSQLEYCERFCPEFKKVVDSPEVSSKRIFFADFEACTKGEIHQAYYFAIVGAHGYKRAIAKDPTVDNEIWRGAIIGSFIDGWNHMIKEAGEQEMFRGGRPTMYIYFHNLDYDCAFLLRFLGRYCKGSLVTNENTIIGFDIDIPNFPVRVRIRDSYRYITHPLRNFDKLFDLPIEKEIYPYDYYQTSILSNLVDGKWGRLEEFLSHVHDENVREELKARASKFVNPDNPQEIDVYGYAGYYCLRDCEVLMEGFLKFRDQLIFATGLDPLEYYTISSLAYAYLNKEGVFEGCHQLSGPPLLFIRKCVNGGRCMLAGNRKVIAKGPIADFDAVSLYPSAMKQLWTVRGLPKIVPRGIALKELTEHANDFFVEVEIKRVPKALDFPLIPHKRGETKTYLNEPTDSLYVDNLWIEDLMTFHELTEDDIVIKRGYYFDEGRNFKIREVIETLFNQRVVYKQQGNPLEQTIKLLMNSCYGKSILKPVFFEKFIMDGKRLDAAIASERSALLCFQQLDECDNYLVKENAKLKTVIGFPTFGVQVLSMSKRIMSQVMVTAQDHGIPIYYTDTDSMHLPEDRIENLADIYKRKYGRELIGKELGQFHSDFSVEGKKGDWYSDLFIGVGKKCYLDVLKNRNAPTDENEYHVRLKGVPMASYDDACEKLGVPREELMNRLFNGDSVTFNLLAGDRVSFARTAGLARHTRESFTRCVKFLDKFPFMLESERLSGAESERQYK